MYQIAVRIVFNAGHAIRLPQGVIEKPHRHEWVFTVTAAADELDRFGLVMDFHALKRLMQQAAEPLEKAEMINDLAWFRGKNPTTEMICGYLADALRGKLPGHVRLAEAELEEEPGCRVIYKSL